MDSAGVPTPEHPTRNRCTSKSSLPQSQVVQSAAGGWSPRHPPTEACARLCLWVSGRAQTLGDPLSQGSPIKVPLSPPRLSTLTPRPARSAPSSLSHRPASKAELTTVIGRCFCHSYPGTNHSNSGGRRKSQWEGPLRPLPGPEHREAGPGAGPGWGN